VAVTITTYVVTYKLRVNAVISAPVTSYIPFYFRRIGNNCCGGRSNPIFGYVTAYELFQNQEGFQDLGYCVQFKKEAELSYVGETVEFYKEMKKL